MLHGSCAGGRSSEVCRVCERVDKARARRLPPSSHPVHLGSVLCVQEAYCPAVKYSFSKMSPLLSWHQLIGMLCPSHKPWMVSLRFSAPTNSVRASPRQEMAVYSSHYHILLLLLLPYVTFSAPASPVANSYLPPPPETDSEVLAGEDQSSVVFCPA